MLVTCVFCFNKSVINSFKCCYCQSKKNVMKLKVVFGLDPTGYDLDIEEVINIPSNTCLYCCHDSRLNIPRLHDEVKKSLESKGYDLRYYFNLLKVHSL